MERFDAIVLGAGAIGAAAARLVVAGGGSGHALEFGPPLGEIAADLAHGRPVSHPIGGFALGRLAPS